MSSLKLEAENLGRKHQQINQLVNDYIQHEIKLVPISQSSSDIDNLLKIEIASSDYNQNVDYIIEILKSEDLLYVSRAIKRSPWLITDRQHSHIINPEYLHTVLIPLMTPKAVCKLLLQVRLLLKDEDRVDEFYKFYEDRDKKHALKWVPNCSKQVIDNFIKNYTGFIDVALYKRLSEKTTAVLDLLTNTNSRYYPFKRYMSVCKSYIKTHTEKYLETFEKLKSIEPDVVKFNTKHSQYIMTNHKERVLTKFDKYAGNIDINTVAKNMGSEEIKEFLIKLSKDKAVSYWFIYENIKPLLEQLPKKERFDFAKKLFIDKVYDENRNARCAWGEGDSESRIYRKFAATSSANVYIWYSHATFANAITDLKPLIKTESAPDERAKIFKVLLASTAANLADLQELLQFYLNNHINEPLRYKNEFVNAVVLELMKSISSHKFNDSCWKLLDVLFHSMEVYVESKNNVQNCLKAVILHKCLSDQSVPEIVEKKFTFSTFKDVRNNLTSTEQDKVFNYLFKLQEDKLKNSEITDKEKAESIVSTLSSIMELLKDWNKDFTNYPILIEKIKEIINLKQKQDWKVDIEQLYNKNKSWRRHMFEESLLMSQKEEVFLNVLKHDVSLLERHAGVVEAMRCDDNVVLDKTLSKIKTYWPNSIAVEWSTHYRKRLGANVGLSAAARGLCKLLPRDDLVELLKKYEPNEKQINWSQTDELMLSLRKNFSKVMHIGRPQVPPSSLLPFAQGDYLQFALPSLAAIFYNLPPPMCKKYLSQTINGSSVSLQKHGVRLAFSKLKSDELEKLFSEIWNTTRNPSIRAAVFTMTFSLLRKEKNAATIESVWQLFQSFIDDLTFEESKTVYAQLGHVAIVPELVRAQFCIKSYKFLKKLPAKLNCGNIIQKVVNSISTLIDDIEPDVVMEVILDYLKFANSKQGQVDNYSYNLKLQIFRLGSDFVVRACEESEQLKRYDKVLKPCFEYTLKTWKKPEEGDDLRFSSKETLDMYHSELFKAASCALSLRKYAIPVKVYDEIISLLENGLSKQNYYLLIIWKLTSAFFKSYKQKELELKNVSIDNNLDYGVPEDHKYFNETWPHIVHEFASNCSLLLTEEVNKHFPSIWVVFARSMRQLLQKFPYYPKFHLYFSKALIEKQDIPTSLLAVKVCPVYIYEDDLKKEFESISEIFMAHPSEEVTLFFHCIHAVHI